MGPGVARERSRKVFASAGRHGAAALILAISLGGASACREGGAAKAQHPPTTADRGAESAFCDAAREFVDRLGAVVNPGGPADPSEAAGLYRDLATFFATAARVGPREIRSDAEVAASVVAEYYGALEATGFIEDRIPRETAAKLQSPPFVSAADNVAAYSRAACPARG